MSERAKRTAELVELMKLEDVPDGTRYVTLHGVALGRLKRLEAGFWQCEWRSTEGWLKTPTQLEKGQPESCTRRSKPHGRSTTRPSVS